MSPDATVLVVDDNEDHRFITVTELRRIKLPKRVRIVEAGSGREALELLAAPAKAGQQILVLSDYRMPYMGGVELLTAVRRQFPRAAIRFIVYSSTDQGVAKESLEAGADEFMVKPMDLHEFRRELARAIENWGVAPASSRS